MVTRVLSLAQPNTPNDNCMLYTFQQYDKHGHIQDNNNNATRTSIHWKRVILYNTTLSLVPHYFQGDFENVVSLHLV